jgi:hypothetical protein
MKILFMVHVTQSPIADVSRCSTHISQVKGVYMDPIRVGYTMKQIYDKHKEIWWERANGGEWMT